MTIYELLGFKEESMLDVNVEIEKILKYSREKKSKRELKAELQYINSITLKYSYKSNSFISGYSEGFLATKEFQVIEINVEKPWIITNLAQVVQECIPYPIVFVFVCRERYQLTSCRVGKVSKDGVLIADDFEYSRWIYQEELNQEISECNFENVNTNIFNDANSIDDIFYNVHDIYCDLSNPYEDRLYCLREVMDIFKQIEYTSGKLKLEIFLKRQMLKGNYEILDDTLVLVNFPNELDNFKEEYYFGSLGEFDGKQFYLNKESDIDLTSFDELRDMEDYALQWERDDNIEYDPAMYINGFRD